MLEIINVRTEVLSYKKDSQNRAKIHVPLIVAVITWYVNGILLD